jgi:hypothetical protein
MEAKMATIHQNRIFECSFTSSKSYRDPFQEVDFDVVFSGPGGNEITIPGFWAGDATFKARFSSARTGEYTYRTVCSDPGNADLHDRRGTLEVVPYEGSNALYRHGPIRVSPNRRYLQHEDGTPFFWLADTWWMGLCARLRWPEDFKLLVADRAEKGFTMVQLVAGLLPAFRDHHIWDERAANEGGWPWDRGFARVNPRFFDYADQRIAHLVEAGLVPCVFGAWGEFMDRMGPEKMKQHWRYIVARWGAYPVVWSLGGEILIYTSDATRPKRRADWTAVGQYLRRIDPFQRPITAHPTRPDSREMVDDESILDIDMLQTGHSYTALEYTASTVKRCIAKDPPLPVVNGEVCYEGIVGTCWADVQRFCFYTSLLSGSAGHTYGAVTLHVTQTRSEKRVHDNDFWVVDACWEDDYKLPGSAQVGIGKRLLERYEWWRFEPRPEARYRENNQFHHFAAGIPSKVWLVYLPSHSFDRRFLGYMADGMGIHIEEGVRYRGIYFNPRTEEELELGEIQPDGSGVWHPSFPTLGQGPAPKPTGEDWILILQALAGETPSKNQRDDT